jgi:hypothetical protein
LASNPAPALNPLPLQDNQGGALNLTRVTGIGAALVTVLTTFNGAWTTIFGADTPRWAKPVVIMAVIGTFAVVAAADILGRGYAAAAGKRARSVFLLPKGVSATYLPGEDQKVTLAAVRPGSPEEDGKDARFLIVKSDESTAWIGSDDLKFP